MKQISMKHFVQDISTKTIVGLIAGLFLFTGGCTTFSGSWTPDLSFGSKEEGEVAHRDESDVRVQEGVIHVVQEGETLVGIGRAYHVTPQRLARINRITDMDKIIVGQRVFIPGAKVVLNTLVASQPPGGEQAGAETEAPTPTPTPTPIPVKHLVKAGETLDLISKAYDVPMKTIQRVNNITDPRLLRVGEELLIPGAKEVQTVSVPTPTPIPEQSATAPAVSQTVIDPATGKAREHVELPSKAMGTITFSWPLFENFRVAREFSTSGSSPCFGIDMEAPEGTPIYASADGEVFLVGTSADDFGASYGNYIFLYHGTHEGKGIRTVYAHLSETLVTAGQKVSRGDLIGKVGRSGRPIPGINSGFLHFEIRRVDTPLDPLKYLPKR